MKNFNYILVLLLISMSMTAISMPLPELTHPTDQAENISKTPTLQWMDTGSSYNVEIYECSPDYNGIGQLGLNNYTLNGSPISVPTYELSGLTYANNRLVGVMDEGDLVVLNLDGSIDYEYSRIETGLADIEGIVWLKEDEYLILQEGTKQVIKANVTSDSFQILNTFTLASVDCGPSAGGDNKCLEGISYNPLTKEVIVVKEKNPVKIYTFTLPTTSGNVSVSEPFNIQSFMNNVIFGSGDDLAGLHHLARTDALNELAASDRLLILSEDGDKLIEADLSGNVYDSLSIAGAEQPEGVTMDNQGNIYIISEGANSSSPSTLYRFTNPNLDLTPFNTSTLVFSNSSISGTSITIPEGVLDSNKEYCWRVKNNDTELWSDYSSFTTENNPICRVKDSLALVALYNSTDGANWKITWDLAQPIHQWHGVLLDTDCVTRLILGNNDLNGNIPSEIGDMTNLLLLDLSNNELNGNIPSEIYQLPLYILNLSVNNLSGSIPQGIENLTNLRQLNLYGNGLNGNDGLSGNIPPQIGQLSNLVILNLAYNNFINTIPQLSNLSILQTLLLHHNELSGSIPPELSMLNNLRDLRLENNSLTGSIPHQFGDMNTLTYFSVNDNNLAGCYDTNLNKLCTQISGSNSTISEGNEGLASWEDFCNTGAGNCSPYNACRLRDSTTLVDFYNSTNGPNWTITWNLAAPMNTWHGVSLSPEGCVESIIIGTNKIGGTLPTSIGDLSELKIFALGGNEIGGNIPSSIGQLTQLTNLGLGGNNFTGGIPPQIGDMTSLQQLWLAGNENLGGNIPPKLGQLTNLTHFVLNDCGLTGSLPKELAGQTNIDYWRIFNNDLSGCYPPELAIMCSRLRPGYNGNDKISDGNDFGIDWETFCNTGVGNCSPYNACRERDRDILIEFYNSTNGPNWTIKWDLTKPMDTWHGVILSPEGCVESIIIGTNKIGGILPASIGDLSEMKIFALGGNEIGGNIPSSIGQLTQLTNLGLGGNNFTGGIPPQIGDMASLQQLWLAGNENLGGNIPPKLGQLTNLTHFVLNDCGLTGSLPKELAGQTNIDYWRIFNNDLSGCYPPELAIMCSRLRPGYNGDDKISDGTGLSSWESFCANQSGVCQAGAKVSDAYISSYNIYPNPTQNGTTLHLEFDSQTDSGDATLSIYNITGQLIQREDLTIQNGQNHFTTTLEQYAAGVYFVKLQSGTYTGTQKLIIQ